MNTSPEPRYRTRLARNTAEIRRTQQLRYRVFGEELGAELNRDLPGHDSDRFDPHCWHLMVTDGDRVVACTRLLDSRGAARAGGFYSAGEFDLQMLASLPGAVLEVGRTCVDPAYRNGGVISALWSGIAGLVRERQVDYLFGCASIGLEDGGANAHGILERVRARHLSPERQRVRPLRPMPAADGTVVERPTLPPLLKAYLSLGAVACGEACWDPAFNCVDLFMLLNVGELHPRYARRFFGLQANATSGARRALHS